MVYAQVETRISLEQNRAKLPQKTAPQKPVMRAILIPSTDLATLPDIVL